MMINLKRAKYFINYKSTILILNNIKMANSNNYFLQDYNAYLEKLQLSSKTIKAPRPKSRHLSFGIDAILAMKCSKWKKRSSPISATNKTKSVNGRRSTFTTTQLDGLESSFKVSNFIVGRGRTELAAKLNLEESRVRIWFKHRRTKDRRRKTSNY